MIKRGLWMMLFAFLVALLIAGTGCTFRQFLDGVMPLLDKVAENAADKAVSKVPTPAPPPEPISVWETGGVLGGVTTASLVAGASLRALAKRTGLGFNGNGGGGA